MSFSMAQPVKRAKASDMIYLKFFNNIFLYLLSLLNIHFLNKKFPFLFSKDSSPILYKKAPPGGELPRSG